jgi:hypothetical protein
MENLDIEFGCGGCQTVNRIHVGAVTFVLVRFGAFHIGECGAVHHMAEFATLHKGSNGF